uniref:glycerophosphodiester phosphodiesterase family protein n=1 Tax=Staphylococcus aureus TaxID=1280 RepID=UPI0027D25EED
KLTKAKLKMVKEAGFELNLWTVTQPARAYQLANWGVDGIFKDNAVKMVHLSQ